MQPLSLSRREPKIWLERGDRLHCRGRAQGANFLLTLGSEVGMIALPDGIQRVDFGATFRPLLSGLLRTSGTGTAGCAG